MSEFELEVGDIIEVAIKDKRYNAEVLGVDVPTIKVGDIIYTGKFFADGSGITGKYIFDYEKKISIYLPKNTKTYSLNWDRETLMNGITSRSKETKYYLSKDLAEADYQAFKETMHADESESEGLFGKVTKTLVEKAENTKVTLTLK